MGSDRSSKIGARRTGLILITLIFCVEKKLPYRPSVLLSIASNYLLQLSVNI